ncbi:MAG: hypothetical protein ICV79_19590 [Flavisolibacter sp.]|nr:hypothetical protein [Flavisolibacter sp.]
MDNETNRIPNVKIQNIGTGKNPLNAIKGLIELPCWSGYYLYGDTCKLKKDKVVTNGRIELWVDGEMAADGSLNFTQEQINAYFYLLKHQESIKHSILKVLKQEFPHLLSKEYVSWDHEDADMPKLSDLTQEFDFKDYIGPESISIRDDVKEEAAYIQWRFRCRWDVEHGLDIITHKERVIEIAPEADPWKIYKDNGTYEQEEAKYKDKVWKLPTKKKWWQFW